MQSVKRSFNSAIVAAVLAASFGIGQSSVAEAARVNLLPAGAESTAHDVFVKVKDTGSHWTFTFKNKSQDRSSLTGVWFEDGFSDGSLIKQGSGLKGVGSKGTKLNRRSAALQSDSNANWQGDGLGFSADKTRQGVNWRGQWFKVTAKKADRSLTLADMLLALSGEGTRIAVYAKSFGDGGQTLTTAPDHHVSNARGITSVPSPAAIGPGLALLGMLSMRRRRQA